MSAFFPLMGCSNFILPSRFRRVLPLCLALIAEGAAGQSQPPSQPGVAGGSSSGAVSNSSAASSPYISLWSDVASLLTQEAANSFAEAYKKTEGKDRDAAFGYAVTLLNRQPKTESNVDESRSVFTELARLEPADEIAIQSRYYLARIAQIHQSNEDLEKAATLYDELYAQHPGHLIAQLGLVRSALIRLYSEASQEEKQPHVQRFLSIAPTLSEIAARREMERVLGNYFLMAENNVAAALPHLIIAEGIGFEQNVTKLDSIIAIAEGAREIGQNDLAIKYYQKFLAETQRDKRVAFVKELLAGLQSGSPQGSAGPTASVEPASQEASIPSPSPAMPAPSTQPATSPAPAPSAP